jgi:uncharacterized repeat protein (TIGR03803 family)
LYGTTNGGGAFGDGTIFSITPGGKERAMYGFSTQVDGGIVPYAGLIDVKGTRYSTTSQGGGYTTTCPRVSCGTVFSITTKGVAKRVYAFGAQANDDAYPVASLLNVNGTLHGTTSAGGKHGCGTVFSIDTAGNEQVLYSFGATRFFDGADLETTVILKQLDELRSDKPQSQFAVRYSASKRDVCSAKK